MHARFEQILSECPIIDYDKPLELLDMCHLLSIEFEKLEGLDNRFIANLLRNRENDYSTALSQFSAMPHFKLDGECKFYIVMLRCKPGIHFSSLYPNIRAVFAFASSRDERDLHLHALSELVKRINHSEFEKRWLSAKKPEDLRSIFVKSKSQKFLSGILNRT